MPNMFLQALRDVFILTKPICVSSVGGLHVRNFHYSDLSLLCYVIFVDISFICTLVMMVQTPLHLFSQLYLTVFFSNSFFPEKWVSTFSL